MKSEELWFNFDEDKHKGAWYDGHEEPDANLDAWIIIQTGEDMYECIKYAGYAPEYMK